ncbi:MAG: hypothetical protein QM487_04300 [Candidatus Marithrix sp.]
MMDSPIVIACLVFISIYLLWFIIRLFADFVLVGIAFLSAVLAYHIQPYYSEILMILTESNLLEFLNLPAESNEIAILKIAGLIIACAVLVSIPILPFSATYRLMFGVEIPVFFCRKNKIRDLITEEIQRQNAHVQPLPENLAMELLPEHEKSEKPLVIHLKNKSIEEEPTKDA